MSKWDILAWSDIKRYSLTSAPPPHSLTLWKEKDNPFNVCSTLTVFPIFPFDLLQHDVVCLY